MGIEEKKGNRGERKKKGIKKREKKAYGLLGFRVSKLDFILFWVFQNEISFLRNLDHIFGI